MKIIFALNQDTTKADMAKIHAAFPGKSIQHLSGVYSGESENSYCIEGDRETLAQVLVLTQQHNQESILIVSDSGKAGLLFCDSGEFQKLSGIWQEVEQSMTKYLDAYSESNGKYYAVI